MNGKHVHMVIGIALAAFALGVMAQSAHALSGAIFTTTADGTVVNENVHYEAKEDVYLDGGPGPRAPAKAAGLPKGDYYFQVTDPSGKDLLSTDHISCRKIHVNEFGVIDFVYPGTCYEYSNPDKAWQPIDCQHEEGVDEDHSELGAITVQLYPYDDTPNPGGVYKVWVTPIDCYTGDPDFVPQDRKDQVNGENYQPGNYHGFVPACSKTDNFKVKYKGKPCPPPVITVRKFHDANINGIQDEGEADITGWAVDVTDPLSMTNTEYTPVIVVAEPDGLWIIVESRPAGTLQTVSLLDGVISSLYPYADPGVSVWIAGECDETHEVVYGNVGLGRIKACKVYDRNANGVADEGEPGVPGWKMQLTGIDVLGRPVGPVEQLTGALGCTTFEDLLPGTYTVTEVIPTCGRWSASGATSATFTIESSVDGATVVGSSHEVAFTNYCTGTADFGTKGYWGNKNGLAEITQAGIDFVNALDPYDGIPGPSSYFGAGDEPFDGEFDDETDVPAAFNNEDVAPIAAEGTAWAEISHFLTDANAGGDPREQQAQQLLAFIFNVLYRVNGGATIQLPDGTWVDTAALIVEAVDIWANGTAAEQTAMQELLNDLNESDAVVYILYWPCEVVYP